MTFEWFLACILHEGDFHAVAMHNLHRSLSASIIFMNHALDNQSKNYLMGWLQMISETK